MPLIDRLNSLRKQFFAIPDEIHVRLFNQTVVTVKTRLSSKAKRCTLTFLHEGLFELSLPKTFKKEELKQVLDSFIPWMEKTWWEYQNKEREKRARENLPYPGEDTLIPSSYTHTLPDGKTVKVTVDLSSRSKRISYALNLKGEFSITLPLHLIPSEFPKIKEQAGIWFDNTYEKHPERFTEQKIPESIFLPLLSGTIKIVHEPVVNQDLLKDPQTLHTQYLHWKGNSDSLCITLNQNRLYLFGIIDQCHPWDLALKKWCRLTAERTLPPLVKSYAQSKDFPLKGVKIRDQKSRWASCSARQLISMNWRAIFLSKDCFEHLCWHELCHLRHMNHSKEFHEELERLSPDWRLFEKKLSEAWNLLPVWAL